MNVLNTFRHAREHTKERKFRVERRTTDDTVADGYIYL